VSTFLPQSLCAAKAHRCVAYVASQEKYGLPPHDHPEALFQPVGQGRSLKPRGTNKDLHITDVSYANSHYNLIGMNSSQVKKDSPWRLLPLHSLSMPLAFCHCHRFLIWKRGPSTAVLQHAGLYSDDDMDFDPLSN
jgi:hypothetical protein